VTFKSNLIGAPGAGKAPPAKERNRNWGQSCFAVLNALVARQPRVEFPGALYHVIVRRNERKSVFRSADRARYLERLAHYREKFQFRLLAYCLMDNHVHLAVETGRHPLPRVMAGLQTSYTQYFNRRHDRVGHLFQGRYEAFVVEQDRHGLALLRQRTACYTYCSLISLGRPSPIHRRA
jgi:REP-associated tyrosine transposase